MYYQRSNATSSEWPDAQNLVPPEATGVEDSPDLPAQWTKIAAVEPHGSRRKARRNDRADPRAPMS